jgi:hypothetical protein
MMLDDCTMVIRELYDDHEGECKDAHKMILSRL